MSFPNRADLFYNFIDPHFPLPLTLPVYKSPAVRNLANISNGFTGFSIGELISDALSIFGIHFLPHSPIAFLYSLTWWKYATINLVPR